MWKNRILYLLSLTSAFAFHCFFSGWFSEYLLLFLLVLPVFSLLLSLPAMCTMRLSATGPSEAALGAETSVVLWTSCRLPQPRCRFCLTVQNPLTELFLRRKFRPDSLRIAVPLPTEHCGTLHCAVTKGRVYDYLGLFRLPRRWTCSLSCRVLPCAIALEDVPSLQALQPLGFFPKAGGGVSEYHELREYLPGDNLRQIHWKLTAKLDVPIVREPQIPAFPKLVVSLDFSVPALEIDRIMGQTIYLSQYLLEHHIPHCVCWVSGTTPREQWVERPEDITSLIHAMAASEKARFSNESNSQTRIEEGGISYDFR